MDGFGDVFSLDRFGAGEVGHGAGDFEDAVVGAGAEVQLFHRGAKEVAGGVVEGAVFLEVARLHPGVAVGLAAPAAVLGLAGFEHEVPRPRPLWSRLWTGLHSLKKKMADGPKHNPTWDTLDL